jgi:hypothetical protein
MITHEDLLAAGFKPVPNIKLGIEEPVQLYRHPNWTDPVPEIHVNYEPWHAKAGAMQNKLRTKEDLDFFMEKVVKFFCLPK